MEIDKERNRLVLERVSFHLDEAARFCNQLDLSGLAPLEQKEWDRRIKICKDALQFTKGSLKELNNILE